MVYAGILAHGTSMSAAEMPRMMPQLSATGVRQAMRWAGDERGLAQAYTAMLSYMHRHPIASWRRSNLASSDMVSLETRQRVWQARLDPRRQTPSVGLYSHLRDRWGISMRSPSCSTNGKSAPPLRACFDKKKSRSRSWRSTRTGTLILEWPLLAGQVLICARDSKPSRIATYFYPAAAKCRGYSSRFATPRWIFRQYPSIRTGGRI